MQKKMIFLTLLSSLCITGCATPFLKKNNVPNDYVDSFGSSVTQVEEVVYMDGGSGGIELKNKEGKSILIVQDFSGSHQPETKLSWYGREYGTIVLGGPGGREIQSLRERDKLIVLLDEALSKSLIKSEANLRMIEVLKKEK